MLESTCVCREWPRYCRKAYWTKMDQNGPNHHFGQNDLIPNWILAFARPKWTKMVHFGPFRSANRTLAIPEFAQGYERWRIFVTKIDADLAFQACISFLRCFRTHGTPISKILVHIGMPCYPVLSLDRLKLCKFASRSDLVLISFRSRSGC